MVVALSGGVDSAVAAALLVEAGCRVIGLTLKLWDYPSEVEGGCCSATDITDARRLAADFGFPHYVLDERERFSETVVDPFLAAYQGGRTPSPCVTCNQQIKFHRLLLWMARLESRWLATGHYARLGRDPREGRPLLLRGTDPRRDQSYFLHGLPRGDLDHLAFPLGHLTKEEVRAEGRRLGVRVAEKPDSQDLCFLPGGDPTPLMEARGRTPRPGVIRTREGNVLGEHPGVHRYTIGQRRGLPGGGQGRLYVLDVDGESAAVTVGSEGDLLTSGLRAEEFRWQTPPPEGALLTARIRSRAVDSDVEVAAFAGETAWLRFSCPQAAVTPGQKVVVYAGELVCGGGTIASRWDPSPPEGDSPALP